MSDKFEELREKKTLMPRIRDCFQVDETLATDDELWEKAEGTLIVASMILNLRCKEFFNCVLNILVANE